jgi:hypothetical protein
MARLTGYDLLAHHRAFHSSKADKVREAGYIRVKKDGTTGLLFNAYYEQVLRIKHYDARRKLTSDDGGTATIRRILWAIQHCENYKNRNDEVVYFPDQNISSVRYYGETIAMINHRTGYVKLFDKNRSKSTKERMNRILMRISGCQLYQRAKVWYVHNPMIGDIVFEDRMIVDRVPYHSEVFG